MSARRSPTSVVAVVVPLGLAMLILLLAGALRLHNLETQSLWNDEGSSYVQAARSFSEIAEHAARDIHPPGYYWLLALWRALTGDSEFALRALSVFASLLTIAFAYALGVQLYSPLAGTAAALLVTLNTFSIYYAQEARMYALLGLWAAASMWAFIRLVQADRVRSGLAWQVILPLGMVNAAGLYTQYAFPFVMLAQGVLFLFWLTWDMAASLRRDNRLFTARALRRTGHFILASLLALALFLPWLPTALGQVTGWPNTGDATPLGLAVGTITGWLIFGVTFTSDNLGSTSFLFIFLSLAIVPLATRPVRRILWRAAVPALWLVLTVGLFLGLGLFREANLKFLLPAQIAFALWMGRSADVMWAAAAEYGAGLSALLRTAMTLGFGVLLLNLSGGLALLYTDPQFQRADYRGIAAGISAVERPGDAIILNAPNQEEVFRYYYRGGAPIYPLPLGLGRNDEETRAAVETIVRDHERVFVLFWGEAERDPNRAVETTLDALAFEAGTDTWYGDVRLAAYVMPVALLPATLSGARFGAAITLEGYALSAETVAPGDVLQVELWWQTSQPLDRRYKVFVQLLNGDGFLAAQRDSEPGGGSRLTINWQPGETISDRHGLAIPADLAPGDYTLIVGLYDPDASGARLPVGAGDYLTLAVIKVNK